MKRNWINYSCVKGTGKCLIRVQDDDDHRTTIGSAAVQCAIKNAKLVSFSDCPSIEATMEGLKNYDHIKNQKFWFGVFAPGEINKRKGGKRNFLEVGQDYLIDSYVHTYPEYYC